MELRSLQILATDFSYSLPGHGVVHEYWRYSAR